MQRCAILEAGGLLGNQELSVLDHCNAARVRCCGVAGSHERREIYLTQWHHRWAQPFNCLVVVMLATPLGVVFSRRGTTGGVAVTVFLCVGMLFFTTICLSLGDAKYVPPMLAAWLPNLLFGGLALYLFQRRLAGRPIYQTLRRLTPNNA